MSPKALRRFTCCWLILWWQHFLHLNSCSNETPDGIHSSASVFTNVVFCLNVSPSLMSAFQHTPGTRSQPLPTLEICQCFFSPKCEAAAGRRVVQPPAQSMCLSVHVEQVDMCQTGVCCAVIPMMCCVGVSSEARVCVAGQNQQPEILRTVFFFVSARTRAEFLSALTRYWLMDWALIDKGLLKKQQQKPACTL